MRRRLFEIIEVSQGNDKLSTIYDVFMISVIVISVIPLAFVTSYPIFDVIDKMAAIIFIIDYIARIATADLKMRRKSLSFIYYPFTPMAIIDLLSILPSMSLINSGWRLLKISRLFRTLRVFRVFKAVRYSKNISILIRVFKKQKDILITIFGVAILYILISALIVLNVEPETFGNYFSAVYWATISLTTMGYGDIYPVTTPGQIVTMLSSFVGIAIIAMPAGVITSGFMEEINSEKKVGERKVDEEKII